jgi:hypothetical protein
VWNWPPAPIASRGPVAAMHRWTAAEKTEVLRLRAAGLSWPEIHKRLGLPISLRALRHAGYNLGVAKRPRYNPRRKDGT